jgi:poly(hydroxyalkanoate) depolymerase family esterase
LLHCNKVWHESVLEGSGSEPRLIEGNAMPVITPRVRLRKSRKGMSAFAPPAATQDRLHDLQDLGDNPGNLRGRYYVPEGLSGPVPLVVVLHGCTQNAAVYDHGSGWSTMADRHGFMLLFPEQQRANNPMLCFNWFSDEDTRRGLGEAASIRSMIDRIGRMHEVDASRVFVTGLSAGGAMTSVMLATYPDVFAAGAILAGVAYGCASDVAGAFECMGGRSRSDARALGRTVRSATRHQGPWPRVQIWHGSADNTVVPSNADAIIGQWADVHGLGTKPDRVDEVEGYPRRAWLDSVGKPVIEHYAITGMAHGVPLSGGGEDPLGVAGAHMLDVGLSSTARIAAFFGIAPEEEIAVGVAMAAAPKPAAQVLQPMGQPPRPAMQMPQAADGPQQVIEKALRAAGLMR